MIATLLRQPLLHFFVIGAALFALFAATNDTPAPASGAPDTIVVSVQDATWLAQQFEATWRRAPTPDELESLIDEFVREEVYVREALALGLDQGDTIVRRRLRQKMEFLTEASAEAANPDEALLRAHYQENADRFERPARIAFSQILLPEGDPTATDTVLADLAAGADPQLLGARTLLPARVPVSPREAVDGTFGQGVYEQIAALEPGSWTGPVASGYGLHVVRLDTLEPAALPPFETMRQRVELDWRSEMAERLRGERYDLLAAQYAVERPDPVEVLGQ